MWVPKPKHLQQLLTDHIWVSELASKIDILIIMLLANTYIALTTYRYFF